MSKKTRQDIKTIETWTLQGWENPNGRSTYVINTDGQPTVSLWVESLPDFNSDRMVHTVKCSPYSRMMDVEETAEFVKQVQQALEVATEFQKAIDEIENSN